MRKTIFGLILTLSLNAHADFFTPFDAHYELRKGSIKAAVAHVSLRRSDNEFTYKSFSETAGIVSLFRGDTITEISRWHLDKNKNVIAKNYKYIHMRGKSRKKYKAVDFDWSKRIAHMEFKHRKADVPIKAGALDEFSLQIAMMRDLKNKRKQLEYWIVEKGELRHYHFAILGTEKVETPAGVYETVKLKRIRKTNKRVTYMWCAPSLRYLPVKIMHIEKDGSAFTMRLNKYKTGI